MLDGSALIQLSGLPEGMTLTECARTEEGLSFTLERSAAYDSSTGQEPEELADLELTLTVSGSVLAADAQTSAGASEIRLDAELESVPLAGTADSRTASAACSISADGEKRKMRRKPCRRRKVFRRYRAWETRLRCREERSS